MFWTLSWAGDPGLRTCPAHREPVYSLVGGRGSNWVLQSREEENQEESSPDLETSRKKWQLKMDLSKAPRLNHHGQEIQGSALQSAKS